jgi:hypothetical protein
MSKAKPVIVVNVVSTSFSGSTWVNLLLGSHSQAFSAGEMKQLLKIPPADCTLHGKKCSLWTRFKFPSKENPFRQLSRLTGKRVLVVNNSRKFLPMQQEPGIRSRFVHLVRDGRAVVASFLRKSPDMSVWSTARLWNHDLRRNHRLIRRQPRKHVTTLLYENIHQNTEPELRRLCGFIGIDYEPSMLQFWTGDRHYLGGNRGTLYSILRKTDAAAPAHAVIANGPATDTLNWDLNYYKKTDPAKFVDERWKHELSDHQLRLFGLLAGRVNRRFGYPRSTDRS